MGKKVNYIPYGLYPIFHFLFPIPHSPRKVADSTSIQEKGILPVAHVIQIRPVQFPAGKGFVPQVNFQNIVYQMFCFVH